MNYQTQNNYDIWQNKLITKFPATQKFAITYSCCIWSVFVTRTIYCQINIYIWKLEKKADTNTWKYCPGNFSHHKREDLTVPKLLQLCAYSTHEAWVVGHLNSKDSFCGPHNQYVEAQFTDKHLKLKLEVVLWSRLLSKLFSIFDPTNFWG